MGLEKDIEKKARERMQEHGGRLMKFVSPGNNGVADRIAIHPASGVFFMEFKARGKRATPLQRARADEFAGLGQRVYLDVDTVKMAYEIIDDEVAGRPGARWAFADGLG